MAFFNFGKKNKELPQPVSELDEAVSAQRTQIFVSHRYDEDQAFLAEVRDRLEDHVVIDDDSLTREQMLAGPRGGRAPDFSVKKEICERIRRSDIVLCRNTPSIINNDWISWEIDTAAIALRKPILFVDDRFDAMKGSSLYTELKKADANVSKCALDGHRMRMEIEKLIGKFNVSAAA